MSCSTVNKVNMLIIIIL